MTPRLYHLRVFGVVAIVAWFVGTLLLVYLWPHIVNNVYKKAVLSQGFGNGPIPPDTLFAEPPALFTDPLHPPASASKLATTGVNHDTLLVVGWLDLSSRPRILHVPDFSGRYYSVQFTDRFDVDFAYVGTRATGTRAGDYLLTGPRWTGRVPHGMTQISSPDNSVLVVGRILVYSESDVSTAFGLAKQIQLAPLATQQPQE